MLYIQYFCKILYFMMDSHSYQNDMKIYNSLLSIFIFTAISYDNKYALHNSIRVWIMKFLSILDFPFIYCIRNI